MNPDTPRRPRLAVNPIAYWARDGKTPEVLGRAFEELAGIGFTAVKADVPEGMTAGAYRAWIAGFGLAPSLSLFNSAFDETVDMKAELERARRFSGVQAELGLDRTMVSSVELPARRAEPAVGADFNAGRLAAAIENVGRSCEVLQSEGLRPLLHPHVGGVFETEHEITSLLDTLGPDTIGFGPDTGHLRWAGMDPAAMIARYADRVGGIHIKDVFPDYLEPASRAGMAYFEVTGTGRMWAEPGLGVLDLPGILATMPANYDGDYMVEVDRPSMKSLYDSHKISFDWAASGLNGNLLATG
ncbi:inosose dehydratase [Arthrobacter silviterrae]|uniref:TIM barrel protein n=1 Tax=Arthrobacter silviterrae TaxID=2026658 RepID=A0ABX0DBT1_9MICC|nr:sugar phosphate isomerase/epimerase [Arthrobacter silviterrae]MDQ0277006.1 inosose dehydratase [Arthrobacter silviterrae]NGN82794.1 TIM barrel protein [Arthrobacter silviterrae]